MITQARIGAALSSTQFSSIRPIKTIQSRCCRITAPITALSHQQSIILWTTHMSKNKPETFPAPQQTTFTPSANLISFFGFVGTGPLLAFPASADQLTHAAVFGDLADGLETPVQLIYLLSLLGFLVVGAFLVVRQVLIRRELEEAAKVLGDRVRANEATAVDYFELGVILLRKKLFTQATKNLEKAKKQWDGDEEDLAQVHNALGYAYFNKEKLEDAVEEYKAAVSLQPGYVTAWNNLGDVYEKLKKYQPALDAYNEALVYSPDNSVARARADFCKTRLDRISGNSS